MVAFDSLLIAVPIVAVGLLIAFAGRVLHHLVVSVTGFMVGFLGVMIGYGAPRMGVEWWEGDPFGLVVAAILGIGLAVVAGYITFHLAWMAYMFAVMLPGWIAGGAAGLVMMSPVQGGFDLVVVAIVAIIGGALMWALHEFLLVVNTALLGGILVGVGVTGEQLTRLPVFRRPERLLEDPVAVLSNTLGAAELFGLTVVVVFVLGMIVQFGVGGGAAEG